MRTAPGVVPTGREVHFGEDEIIVSKTDLRGIITYANHVFQRVSGYTEAELLGKPHNIVRHPDMPRCVFKLAWDMLKAGDEVFAYVLNMAKSGAHYWVFAHMTPSHDRSGRHVGYHSSRRVPYQDAIARVTPLYRTLREEEARHPHGDEGMLAAERMLQETLARQRMDYSQFLFSLSDQTRLAATRA